jgi:hypothetical protein
MMSYLGGGLSSKKEEGDSKHVKIDSAQLIELVDHRTSKPDFVWSTQGDDRVTKAKSISDSILKDEKQLERLLIARKYNGDKTLDMFFEQVRFRAKYQPSSIDPTTIPNALPSGTWRLCGHTKAGCVISNYKLEYWDPNTYGVDDGHLDEAVEEYTRYVCYMIELMICSMKSDSPDKFAVLFDLTGFYISMVTKTNVRMMIRKLIYVAQAQYPERLEHVFLVNAPFGFETAWALIKPLLDAKTASKITFTLPARLLDYIDASVLSVEYGGEHEEYPIPSKLIQEEAY